MAPSTASTHRPTLFSYIVRYDDGAAPNPYWGTCTLVICKPAIRRKASEGDWIVGLGSKANPTKVDYSGKIVYVMKVTRKMTMRDYNRHTNEQLRDKIPVVPADDRELKRDSREWRLRLGDSIYNFSQKGIPKRPGVHKRKNRITDMSGQNVLLSSEFVYFGAKAIPLPESLQGILHKNQGHRSRLNADHMPAFLNWWRTNRKTFAENRVKGVPQWDVFANRKNLGACAEGHMKEAEEDTDATLGEHPLDRSVAGVWSRSADGLVLERGLGELFFVYLNKKAETQLWKFSAVPA